MIARPVTQDAQFLSIFFTQFTKHYFLQVLIKITLFL